ncbi:MAG: hypothetical protein AAGE93_21250 [Bacteroidota bacterium]
MIPPFKVTGAASQIGREVLQIIPWHFVLTRHPKRRFNVYRTIVGVEVDSKSTNIGTIIASYIIIRDIIIFASPTYSG